jgi:rare lipoprotein A
MSSQPFRSLLAVALLAGLTVLAGCAPTVAGHAALPLAVRIADSASAGVASLAHAAALPGASEGLASWYGPGFAGRRTASGETFDPAELTAAHRTLPFNSRVRVTNLSTGESVIVRINDRGPFVGPRIIDLSRGAAEVISLTGSGVAQVRLEPLSGAGGILAAAPAAHLTPYEVVMNGRQLGELLLLSSAQQAAADPVLVRVIGDEVPVEAGAELLLSEQLFAELGADVTVSSE